MGSFLPIRALCPVISIAGHRARRKERKMNYAPFTPRSSMAWIILKENLNQEDPSDNEDTHIGQGIYAVPEGDIWDLQMVYAENVIGTDYGEGIPCCILESWTDHDGTDYSQVEISIGDYDCHLKKDVFFKFKVIIESKYLKSIQ